MSEASNRISFLASDHAPSHSDIDNSFFQIPNASNVRKTHVSPSLMWTIPPFTDEYNLEQLPLRSGTATSVHHQAEGSLRSAQTLTCATLAGRRCREIEGLTSLVEAQDSGARSNQLACATSPTGVSAWH